jgi:hypothetical protein
MSDEQKTKPDYEQALQWSREEERHEVTWIGHRLGWILISQSFLLTAAIMVQSGDYKPWWFGCIATGILGMLGVWLSLRGILAIRAAQIIIDEGWLSQESYICQLANVEQTTSLDDLYRIPRFAHQKYGNLEKDILHQQAIKLHINIGWAFVYVWVAIYSLGIIRGPINEFPNDHRVSYSSLTLSWFIVIGFIFLFVAAFGFILHFKRYFDELKNSENLLRMEMNSKINQKP